MPYRSRPGRRGGSVLVVGLVLVVICSTIAAGALLSNVGQTREAEAALARERAFQAAEAGLDMAITRLRLTHGTVPSTPTETGAVDGSSTYLIRYTRGNATGADENGDGTVDDAGESEMTVVSATGISGRVRRTVQILTRRAVTMPAFPGAALINDSVPVVTLSGASFTISGSEHLVDGSVDSTRAAKAALSSLAATSSLTTQIVGHESQLTGAGGTPSVGTSTALNLATLVTAALDAGTTELTPGTHAGRLSLGTATEEGMEVVICDGDLHLSGNCSGAGILVVDGDLEITGGFSWVGFILCSGNVRMSGGGNAIRLIGSTILAGDLTVSGNVDLRYSSDANEMASVGLAAPVVLTWTEVGGL